MESKRWNLNVGSWMLSVGLLLAIVVPAFATYSPPGFALDMWFIKDKGVWHQFALNGPHPRDFDKPWPPLDQPGRPPLNYFEQGIFHSTSKDLVAWKDEGVAITIGRPGDWDGGKVASGNIVKQGDTFYLFYVGIMEHGEPGKCPTPIGVATSKDMVHWTKHPANPILVPDPKYYDPFGNWRDCNLHWDAKSRTWYTVVCATAKGDGPMEARACVALAKSSDLIHWECLPPLVITDRYTLGLELPFLFQRGGRWYLGHSMYSIYYSKSWLAKHPEVQARGGVHYFMADNMLGPYHLIEEGLGTQPDPPPYAMQLIDEGRDKLFMHWGPCRYATGLPKKIEFQKDGKMRLVYWKGCEVARKESLTDRRKVEIESGSADIGTATDCFFEGTVEGSVGFALGEKLLIAVDGGMVRSLDPSTRKPREGREAKIPSGKVRIKLIADGSVIDVYANDIWLFAEHCPRPTPDQARIVSLAGRVTVTDLHLDRLSTGNTVHDYGFNY